jgi:hypothetical protein
MKTCPVMSYENSWEPTATGVVSHARAEYPAVTLYAYLLSIVFLQ